MPLGRCTLPPSSVTCDLRHAFRPKGAENALVVLGCGSIDWRKGVDLFLACAAAVDSTSTKRPIRFVWIGHGYDPTEHLYSIYLSEQIVRSRIEGKVVILDQVHDLTPAYEMSDVFFLSSRLDPLPNVSVEAMFQGLPVVCFENASGTALLLGADPSLRRCVVRYLDTGAAAGVIAEFAENESNRVRMGNAMRQLAEATFDMERYVRRLDELGHQAIDMMRQAKAVSSASEA